MRAILGKASDEKFEKFFEISTFEELRDIAKEYGEYEFIIELAPKGIETRADIYITIYDDWIEM